MLSPTISTLAERRVGIFGAGAEGRSTWETLARRGAPPPLVFADREPPPATVPDTLRVVTGEAMTAALAEVDLLVRSPGIRLTHPLLAMAAARGIAVTTTSELFIAAMRAAGLPVLAITGSKGKSTTATLAWRLLRAAGRQAVLAGNIGTPCLDVLDQALAAGATGVLELSSYQCSDLATGPTIAVLLSLFPEHMDWHGGADAYFAAKLRLARCQLPGDLTLYSAADPELVSRLPLGPARQQPFQDRRGLHYGDDGWFRDGERRLFSDREVRLRGRHNRINAVAALAATRPLGAEPAHLERVLADFAGLPHRLEPIGEHAGIRWVDDSISTAPQATVAALEAFAGEVDTLIAGGADRGFDFAVLARALAANPVRTVITLPPGGEAVAAAIRAGCPPGKPQVHAAADLAAAVAHAAAVTAPGRICLLSPGSPSYGAFRNFEERGDRFRALVKAL
ncbi:MAG TPA: UDP-N-acetylmuramoyl-L-alanine--D-glutamate ligase [Thermoanaerobaculia bacterium]|nr:UDP-N-acetylmuramoyl-L-alanine--D-glutamate ligase [Thermoanaerobaculia bacterium]